MKKILLAIITLTLLSLNTCDENPVNGDNIKPGRRDYTWAVDTIPVANSVMKDMWGSSPTDIWICGDGFDRRQSLWHYDGTNFTPYNEYILSATSFCGFAQNNIWMATATGWIYHYDGVKWKKDTVLTMNGYNEVIIQQLCGTSPNNIYATGMAVSLDSTMGVIARFNGSYWSYLTITKINVNFTMMEFDETLDTYLIRGIYFDNPATAERLYTMKNNTLKEIYAGTTDFYLGKIGDRVYIYGDQKIYKYNRAALELFLDLENTNYLSRVSGKSEKDFFCNTFNYENDLFGVGHWNGTDLATLYSSNFSTGRTLFFNDRVIFLSGNHYNEDINVIIKGKLVNK